MATYTANNGEMVRIDPADPGLSGTEWTVYCPLNPNHGESFWILNKSSNSGYVTVDGNGKNILWPVFGAAAPSIRVLWESGGFQLAYSEPADNWFPVSSLSGDPPDYEASLYTHAGGITLTSTPQVLPLVYGTGDQFRFDPTSGELVVIPATLPLVSMEADVLFDLTATGNNQEVETRMEWQVTNASGGAPVLFEIPDVVPFTSPRNGAWQIKLQVRGSFANLEVGDAVGLYAWHTAGATMACVSAEGVAIASESPIV
jgi:hypothetical protein